MLPPREDFDFDELPNHKFMWLFWGLVAIPWLIGISIIVSIILSAFGVRLF